MPPRTPQAPPPNRTGQGIAHSRCGAGIQLAGERQRGGRHLGGPGRHQRVAVHEDPVGLEVSGRIVAGQSVPQRCHELLVGLLPCGVEPAVDRQVGDRSEALGACQGKTSTSAEHLGGRPVEDRVQERQATQPARMPGGQAEGDHTAQRMAGHVRSGSGVRLDHGQALVHEVVHRAFPGRVGRPSVPEQVVTDDQAVGRKLVDHEVPHGVVQAHAVHQHQGRPGPGIPAVQPDEAVGAHSPVSPISSMSEYRLPMRWWGRPPAAAPMATRISSGPGASATVTSSVR